MAVRLDSSSQSTISIHRICCRCLKHHGWRVKELKLAAPAEGQDEFVLQPAEVELP